MDNNGADWDIITVKIIPDEYLPNTEKIEVKLETYNGGIWYFDDLRFHPGKAFMETYTYNGLYGPLTSVTSTDNQVGIGDYDGFYRLRRIKNEHGAIMSEVDIEYGSQE